jgi:hypothetical protein
MRCIPRCEISLDARFLNGKASRLALAKRHVFNARITVRDVQ